MLALSYRLPFAGVMVSLGRLTMRISAALLALGLMVIGPQAFAQQPAPVAQEQSTMVPEFLVLAQAGAERMVREVPVGLTNAQIWGIAVGIVAGALVADLTGMNGLVTLSLAAVGGAAGNMLMAPGSMDEMIVEDDDDA